MSEFRGQELEFNFAVSIATEFLEPGSESTEGFNE